MTQRRTFAQRHATLIGSRWVRTVSCYRITCAYLLVALVVIMLFLML